MDKITGEPAARAKGNEMKLNQVAPRGNGYIESFNGKLRDKLLKREVFDTLFEAQILIERWRLEYNTVRPHSSLGNRPPAPETIQPKWLNQKTLSHKHWHN
jgi:transposase InsO family protein